MIHFYHGVPGSGKSLFATRMLYEHASKKKHVICNFPITTEGLPQREKYISDYIHFVPNGKLKPDIMPDFTERFLGRNIREHSILLLVDEAEILFSNRSAFGRGSDGQATAQERLQWIYYFSQHRKMGFDVILVAPMKNMVDKQILGCCELFWEFRSVTNFLPKLIKKLPRPHVFCAIALYQGSWGAKTNAVERKVFKYDKKIASLYDTFRRFDADDQEEGEKVRYDERRIQSDCRKHDRNISGLGGSVGRLSGYYRQYASYLAVCVRVYADRILGRFQRGRSGGNDLQ